MSDEVDLIPELDKFYAKISELEAEISNRQSGDSTLNTKINNEITNRINNDNEEISNRVEEDQLLNEMIQNEINSRISADNTLQTNINTKQNITDEFKTYEWDYLRGNNNSTVGWFELFTIQQTSDYLGDSPLIFDLFTQGVPSSRYFFHFKNYALSNTSYDSLMGMMFCYYSNDTTTNRFAYKQDSDDKSLFHFFVYKNAYQPISARLTIPHGLDDKISVTTINNNWQSSSTGLTQASLVPSPAYYSNYLWSTAMGTSYNLNTFNNAHVRDYESRSSLTGITGAPTTSNHYNLLYLPCQTGSQRTQLATIPSEKSTQVRYYNGSTWSDWERISTEGIGTFDELQYLINNCDGELHLTKNYKAENSTTITINESLTIYGHGHIIDGNSTNSTINSSTSLILFDCVLINFGIVNSQIYTINGKIVNIYNCTFKSNAQGLIKCTSGMRINNSLFIGNGAKRSILITDGKCYMIVNNCVFAENDCAYVCEPTWENTHGDYYTEAVFINSTFTENLQSVSIYANESYIGVHNCSFENSNGILVEGSAHAIITQSTFVNGDYEIYDYSYPFCAIENNGTGIISKDNTFDKVSVIGDIDYGASTDSYTASNSAITDIGTNSITVTKKGNMCTITINLYNFTLTASAGQTMSLCTLDTKYKPAQHVYIPNTQVTSTYYNTTIRGQITTDGVVQMYSSAKRSAQTGMTLRGTMTYIANE